MASTDMPEFSKMCERLGEEFRKLAEVFTANIEERAREWNEAYDARRAERDREDV